MSASSYYRAILPGIHLRIELEDAGIELDVSRGLDESEGYDAYVFGRIPGPEVFMFALKAYERGAKIIWDIDDDFPSIPEWSSSSKTISPMDVNYLVEAMKMSSAIVASTAPLAAATAARWPSLGGKVVVAENLVDMNTYFPDLRRREGLGDRTKILWTGSATHDGDLGPVREVARHVQNSNNYVLIMYGYLPKDMEETHGVVHIPWGRKRDYEGALSLIGADIALLPVIDCPFNRCKSAIKFYETTMSGSLCLASHVGPYGDTIEDRITGVLLPHSCNWMDMISEFQAGRMDEDAREMRTNARREVAAEFSWNSDNARRRAWRRLLTDVIR